MNDLPLVYEELHRQWRDLKSYQPGRSIEEIARTYQLPVSQIIKLGSNENPLGPSPKAQQAVQEALSSGELNQSLNLYPEALGDSLLEALGQKYPEIDSATVVVGNGLDNILEGLARLLLRAGDRTLIPVPTFEYYELVSRWSQAHPIFIPMEATQGYQLDISRLLDSLKPGVRLVFLCSPNNPTGVVLERSALTEILQAAEQVGAFVFLDEAYIEFAEQPSMVAAVQEHPNLIIGRTFSKLYGLAALRIGWAVLPATLLALYRKVQTPFSVNRLGLLAARAALSDSEFIQRTLQNNQTGKHYLQTALRQQGLECYASGANFLAFAVGDLFRGQASVLAERLLSKGIILRDASHFRGAHSALLRCTIGTAGQNQRVVQALAESIMEECARR